jgi:hypothetical protein
MNVSFPHMDKFVRLEYLSAKISMRILTPCYCKHTDLLTMQEIFLKILKS